MFGQNKLIGTFQDNSQACSVVGGQCDSADTVRGAESCPEPTSTEVMMTTKFPKQSHPALKKRKLGSNNWDKIHEAIQGRKRDASVCPSDYALCPQSMDGGCCPIDRSCGKSSCYLTSTASAAASACVLSGYSPCAIDEGGGCCPSGYFCATDGCSASPGVSYSETCGINSYLCPASLNYGCCQSGMGCGLDSCYSTAVTTFSVTEVFTTTSNSEAQTITSTLVTASTPASPTVAANTSKASAVPKYTPTPTAIAKVSASSSSGSTTTSNGLSKPELGGIIGGALFILIVILIAAFCILRRIKKATKAYNDAKTRTRSGSSNPQSHRQYQAYPAMSEMSSGSIDPYQMSGSQASRDVHSDSHIYPREALRSDRQDTTGLQAVAEAEGVSPPIVNAPFSPYSPFEPFSPHSYAQPRTRNLARGYCPVATTDAPYSQVSPSQGNASVDVTPPIQQPQSYFDIPPYPQALQYDARNQNLRHGHDASVSPVRRANSQHGRNWSDASDVSTSSSHPLVELDAGDDGKYKFDLSKAWRVLGLGKWSGKVASKKKSQATLSTIYSHTPTVERVGTARLEGVEEEETGSFIGEAPPQMVQVMDMDALEPDGDAAEMREERPISRSSVPSSRGSRPRSGLSNAELREASIRNLQMAKGKGRPKEVLITRGSAGSNGQAVPVVELTQEEREKREKAEEAGFI